MELSGAEIVVRCLQDEGVKHVFGYPGGAVLFIYDEIFKQDKFQHILVRHEQAAVHAADAYSRSSNRTGVALVTSGPGVTNAVTGIATAYMDSIPIVVLTGQVPTHAIGLDAFQECDTVGITRPCVKHNFLVKDVRDLAGAIKKAFYIAQSGRPWPCAGRHPERCDGGALRVRISTRSFDALVQAGVERAFGSDQESGAAAARGGAADGLHGWRGDFGERGGLAEPLRQFAGLSLYQHANGAGGIRSKQRKIRRHAWHARNVRSQHGDAAL